MHRYETKNLKDDDYDTLEIIPRFSNHNKEVNLITAGRDKVLRIEGMDVERLCQKVQEEADNIISAIKDHEKYLAWQMEQTPKILRDFAEGRIDPSSFSRLSDSLPIAQPEAKEEG